MSGGAAWVSTGNRFAITTSADDAKLLILGSQHVYNPTGRRGVSYRVVARPAAGSWSEVEVVVDATSADSTAVTGKGYIPILLVWEAGVAGTYEGRVEVRSPEGNTGTQDDGAKSYMFAMELTGVCAPTGDDAANPCEATR